MLFCVQAPMILTFPWALWTWEGLPPKFPSSALQVRLGYILSLMYIYNFTINNPQNRPLNNDEVLVVFHDQQVIKIASWLN